MCSTQSEVWFRWISFCIVSHGTIWSPEFSGSVGSWIYPLSPFIFLFHHPVSIWGIQCKNLRTRLSVSGPPVASAVACCSTCNSSSLSSNGRSMTNGCGFFFGAVQMETNGNQDAGFSTYFYLWPSRSALRFDGNRFWVAPRQFIVLVSSAHVYLCDKFDNCPPPPPPRCGSLVSHSHNPFSNYPGLRQLQSRKLLHSLRLSPAKGPVAGEHIWPLTGKKRPRGGRA